MSEGVAFKTTDQSVLDVWEKYQEHVADVRARRDAMVERYGRRLMLSSSGFTHGTQVTGFELFDADEPGAVLGDNGELRVPKGGHNAHVLHPNLCRKAGRALDAEFHGLRLEGPDLPGMPGWTLIGLAVLRPAIFVHDGAVWVRWVEDPARGTQAIDTDLWDQEPLSAYYIAREAYDAAKAVEAA